MLIYYEQKIRFEEKIFRGLNGSDINTIENWKVWVRIKRQIQQSYVGFRINQEEDYEDIQKIMF
jgi:hypothetical protein